MDFHPHDRGDDGIAICGVGVLGLIVVHPCIQRYICCLIFFEVKAVELSPHTDYQLKATIKMLCLRQAISAVSGLHRYKIGGKRIQVSLITGGSNKSLALLR